MLMPPDALTVMIVRPYIDLGTGSLIIQIAIASFVGGLFMLKIFWGKVKALFTRKKNND